MFGERWRYSKAFADGGLVHGKMECPEHWGWEVMHMEVMLEYMTGIRGSELSS